MISKGIKSILTPDKATGGSIVKIINFLSRISTGLAMFVLMFMMLLTVSDVFMRYIFIRPITGTTELTEYLMVCALFGIVPCALENRHIKVDVVTQRLPPKIYAIVDIITLLGGLVLVVILAWQGFAAGLYELSFNVKSSMLKIPDFPFYVVLATSFAVLSLIMVVLIIQRIAELVKR